MTSPSWWPPTLRPTPGVGRAYQKRSVWWMTLGHRSRSCARRRREVDELLLGHAHRGQVGQARARRSWPPSRPRSPPPSASGSSSPAVTRRLVTVHLDRSGPDPNRTSAPCSAARRPAPPPWRRPGSARPRAGGPRRPRSAGRASARPLHRREPFVRARRRHHGGRQGIDGRRDRRGPAPDLVDQDLAASSSSSVPQRAGLDDQGGDDRIGVGVAEDAAAAVAAAPGVARPRTARAAALTAPSERATTPRRTPMAPAPTTTVS